MNEDMKAVCEVRDKIMDLLRQANQVKEFSMGDVDFLYKATKAVKNSLEIEEMLDDGGYSQDGVTDYGRGSSYARGRSGYNRSSRNVRRDSMGRYSRDDGRSKMMEHIEAALNAADDNDREAIKRFMRQLENA